MRKKIVDQICRGASLDLSARARALVGEHGNLIEELIAIGFPPADVLDTCSEVTGIPLAPKQWLKAPKPPSFDGLDPVLCRALSAAPVASMAGRLCIAYGDVEMAAQHASLGLPPHQPYLALRAQLERALALLPKDGDDEGRATSETPAPQDAPTLVQAPPKKRAGPKKGRGAAKRPAVEDPSNGFESVQTEAGDLFGSIVQPPVQTRSPTRSQPPVSLSSDLDDPTEFVPNDDEGDEGDGNGHGRERKHARDEALRAAQELLDDPSDFIPAGTPLPPPSAPPPSAGMIADETPWRRPVSQESSPILDDAAGAFDETRKRPAAGHSGSGPRTRGAGPSASGASVPIAAVPPPTIQAPSKSRGGLEVVPGPGQSVPGPGLRPALESSRPARRPETSPDASARVDARADAIMASPPPSSPSSSPSRRADESVRNDVSSSSTRRRGFSIEPSRAMASVPGPAADLDPPLPPATGASVGSDGSASVRRPPTRPFESLDPHVEPSNPTKRPGFAAASETSGSSKRQKVKDTSGPTKKEASGPANKEAAPSGPGEAAAATARSGKLVPVLVGLAAVAVVAAVVVVQTGGDGEARTAGEGAQTDTTTTNLDPVGAPSMDGAVVDDLATRQAELVGKGARESDDKKAVALFDQAIRLSPNAPGSRAALLEKARRLVKLGELEAAQDAVMKLKRRNDSEPIEDQLEQLLEDIQAARQNK